MTTTAESQPRTTEPFGLSWKDCERLAGYAGTEDAACVHRILLAYWHSRDRKARDRALIAEGRRLELAKY